MSQSKTVPEYIENNKYRETELKLLRKIIVSLGLEETIKWGIPCYMVGGKNVIGIAAFKSYVGLWFYNGVLLKDPNKVLINAQEGNTKALRQWRFQSVDEIDAKLVAAYVVEAKTNQEQGKELKPVKAKTVVFPSELINALGENKNLNTHFKSLTPGKQREYAEYIGSAKQEKTRMERMKKTIPLILSGKGLNDQYK